MFLLCERKTSDDGGYTEFHASVFRTKKAAQKEMKKRFNDGEEYGIGQIEEIGDDYAYKDRGKYHWIYEWQIAEVKSGENVLVMSYEM